jgi:hypothetical protein
MGAMKTPLLTRIRHFMGFHNTGKSRQERVAAADDRQTAQEIDNAQGRALERLSNELEMLKTAIHTRSQQQHRIKEKRGDA